jgi:RNA polymerase nonessential primary-like sigma factor
LEQEQIMSNQNKTTDGVKRSATSDRQPRYSGDTVRTYLHEIGRVPLLSHEEELTLGRQVQRMIGLQELQSKLQEELSRPATTEELATAAQLSELELQQAWQQGRVAKKKMIEANLRLVVAIAKKYQKRNLEFLDLIQEGSLGLERGVEKFDPARGYKFSTYAYWWIRQAITRAIAQQARSIRLPIHITEKLNKIKKTQRELSQTLGRSPTTLEIARSLELEVAQVREYLNISRQPISLDVRVGDNQDTELSELLEDASVSPENFTVQDNLRQELHQILDELAPQQRQVLSLRFGLNGDQELSLAKVGEILNLSRERVRQLEHQALAHLRRRHGSFRDYVAS